MEKTKNRNLTRQT